MTRWLSVVQRNAEPIARVEKNSRSRLSGQHAALIWSSKSQKLFTSLVIPDYEHQEFDEEGTEDPSEYDGEFVKEIKLNLLLAYESQELVESMGHTFEDLVFSCTFRGIQCR